MAVSTRSLPESIYEKDGMFFHDTFQTKPGRVVVELDQDGKEVEYQEYDVIPRQIVVLDGQIASDIEKARREAAAQDLDVYHPVHGILRWGRKRQEERPENVGAGQEKRKTVRVPLTKEPPPRGRGKNNGAR